MTDRGFFIRSLIGRVNDEWLSGSGVRAEKHRLEDGNPDLLILELTGERLNDLRKEYGDHREGKLLLNWMLPTEEGTGCAVRDLYQGGGYSSSSLFHRPEFERNHADQAEGAAKDEKKSNVMSLCPDLEKGVVLPSWLGYAKGLWRAFAKKIADGDAAISELARLEAGLNAIFVDARARTAARFDDDPAEKENPLGEIEGRRGVKINAAWGRGGLGRLRIPHGSGRNRLCPFETPESSRIGLNLHLSADAVVSDGRIEPGDRLLSVAVGMVPYPTHTDGPRLMMGGKNMKQAEPGIAGAEPPIVPGYYEGDEAYKIEALEGHRDENGRLSPSIGLNALTVVMPFKGYTYEDGLVVSESLAGRLTIPEGNYSFSKQFECVIRDEDMEALGIEKRSVQALLERFRAEQERAKGRRFVYGDPLPGFDLPLYDERSDEEEKENSPLKPYAWRDIYVHHAPGVLEKVDISIDLTRVESQSKTKPNHPSAHHMTVFLTWRFSVPRPLALGDKLTGRNGNKGVVTKILPDNAMPEVRFKDAPRRAELIISPSSIMGRKNLGQIWEMTHSLLLKELKMEDLADYELPGDAKYASHVAPLFRRLSEIGADERGTFEITGDGVPEGTRAFAGWQYFCRLHHHAWKKLQARGRYAPFEAATGQPMRCGARTGQRLGEMENWSLLSHGAGEVLSGMRTAQTGNFAKTRELLLAVLRSLGINAAGDDAGLHFVRGGDDAPEETLQKALDCGGHKGCHVTYVFSPSTDKGTGEPRARKTLREVFEEALSKIDGDKAGRTVKAANALLESRFFDEAGGLHIETALLDYYPGLSKPLWKFFRGSHYEKVRGLIEYRDGLFDILSGKEGIPRRYLLGRRYNHSGRAVIVPEPSLMPHALLLPAAMLVELLDGYDGSYLRGLPQELRGLDQLRAIVNDCPKRLSEARKIAETLDDYCARNPLWCFAVRQPSLHRHSVQSFRIRCWAEPVIGLPPMVTPGFNADFDGDTMAVFLPPCEWARDLSAYAIENNPGLVGTGKHAFADGLDLALGWWRMKGRETATPLSKYLPDFLKNLSGKSLEERGEALQGLQTAICEASTGAATLAPLEFDTVCDALRGLERKLENQAEAEGELSKVLDEHKDFGLSVMLNSGAKGKVKDVLQMTWAIGEINRMEDRDGEDRESGKDFIEGNLWEGLTEEQLFRYSYPSRYSMAQKKLSVAEAGYLTRQLAEGLYEVTVEAGDCGTDEGLRVECLRDDGGKPCLTVEGVIVPTLGDLKKDLTRVLWGRVPLGTTRCLSDEDIAALALEWGTSGGSITIRSPIHCRKREEGHICPMCYGADRAMKPYDRPEPVREGFSAGLTAAQAIGERGTQLTMKRFHDVAGDKGSDKDAGEERNAIKVLRSLFVHRTDKAASEPVRALFERVLVKGFQLREADSELPQALIHFETALMPLIVRGVGLGEIARESGGRFLSALANERIRELLSGDGPFEEDLTTIKSGLIWEGQNND